MVAPPGEAEALRLELMEIAGLTRKLDLPYAFRGKMDPVIPEAIDELVARYPNADPARLRAFGERFLISQVHLKRVIWGGNSLHTIDGRSVRRISQEDREAALEALRYLYPHRRRRGSSQQTVGY